MLLELLIQDFALIDDLKLEFGPGLNILTGETGAGKSIIIDSVNFVLGGRASKDIIRTGKEKAAVTAVFENIQNAEIIKFMEECGLEAKEDVIILYREISASGRNICRINGKPVTSSILKNIGNYLIDIHGQHEHQSLLNEEHHIDILDAFGGDELYSIKKEVALLYRDMLNVKHQLQSIAGDEIERERKLNLLDYQIKEIDDAKLKISEEEELLTRRNILNNSEKLYSVMSDCYSLLYDGEGNESIYDKLGYVLSDLNSILNIDNKISGILKNIEDAYYTLESAISDIREYRDKIDFNPELINEIEMRLDLINKLKRKYGKTIKDILEYRDSIYDEMQYIQKSEETIAELNERLNDLNSSLIKKSEELSNIRKSVAEKLGMYITDELKFLGMEKSKFKVNVEVLKKDGHVTYGEKGMDIVNFLISSNPGEPLKQLSKIASGGEISRIMLAIKTVLADTDKIPSLIFDEIDTGISGRAAQAVAEKLSEISKSHQVICVTHLPQIASMADLHFYIEKSTYDEKTRTDVKKLDDKSKVYEIARMLGGAKITDLTVKHAEEMLNMASNIKSSRSCKKKQ